MNRTEYLQARDEAWEAYRAAALADETRRAEVENKEMKFGEVSMRYGISVIGEPGPDGYPLYVAMHGGGSGETPDLNNQQWEHMGIYYKDSVKNGIYVNVRGVRDTWDTHGNPESFPLYDRLIENMILFCNADPNRVYFLGFSAGGDGVYIVSPRMADRLAATHMSAGHHNGTSVWNLRNTPIQLQVGMNDRAYGRNKVTVEYQIRFDEMQKQFGGYEHNTFVHVDKPHNFYDNAGDVQQTVIADVYKWLEDDTVTTMQADTDAIHFLDRYVRRPLPERVIWDLGNRAPLRSVESFYWLRADKECTEGFIAAEYSKAGNTVTILPETTAKKFTVLLNDEMLDLDREIKIITPKGVMVVKAERSEAVLRASINERGDINYAFAAEVEIGL